jgi:hypothetical protein
MASKFKTTNASSQWAYTQSRTLQDQVEVQVWACQLQYNVAQAAVLSLCGPGGWEKSLHVLKLVLPELSWSKKAEGQVDGK